MARLVHLNGPPGVGKSTVAAVWADRHPGTLNLDIDVVHRLVGGWQDPETDTWPAVWSLARAMAATHLDAGQDVILPQYHANPDETAALEKLAHDHGAIFHELVLLTDSATALGRFTLRAETSDDPWIRHHHRLIEQSGGPATLAAMHDNLLRAIHGRPAVVVLPGSGSVQQTYAALAEAVQSRGSGRTEDHEVQSFDRR